MSMSQDRDGSRSGPGGTTRGLIGRLRLAVVGLPLIAVMVFLSACTFSGPTMTIDYKSVENKEIWGLYSLVFWLATAVFIVVQVMLFYAVFRFRRRPGQGLPKQVHGNNRLEIGWTIVPALLLVIIAVPTVRVIISQASPPPADAVRVKIIGHQFWWEVRYPDPTDPTNAEKDLVTANEIHLPVNKTAEFELTSHDVQHSFWVPLLGGKMDLYPNRTNRIKYTAEEVGKYYGQCAELCGTAHGYMKMYVFVEEQTSYDQWFAAQKGQPVAAAAGNTTDEQIKKGQALVTGGACVTCHYIEGTAARGRVGPNLTHFGGRTTFSSGWAQNNEANLKIWIRNPADIKPGVTTLANQQIPATGELYSRMPAFPNYTEEELTAIVKYLGSLK